MQAFPICSLSAPPPNSFPLLKAASLKPSYASDRAFCTSPDKALILRFVFGVFRSAKNDKIVAFETISRLRRIET